MILSNFPQCSNIFLTCIEYRNGQKCSPLTENCLNNVAVLKKVTIFSLPFFNNSMLCPVTIIKRNLYFELPWQSPTKRNHTLSLYIKYLLTAWLARSPKKCNLTTSSFFSSQIIIARSK